MAGLIVHHLNNSRSQRVLWLLEELGVAYDVVRYERDPKTMLAPKALKAVHPLGKSPVLTDASAGATVAESGAIIEYLLERYGNGRLRPPAGTPEALKFTYWLHYAEGSAMPPLLLKLIFSKMPQQAPLVARPLVSGVSQAVLSSFVDPQLKLHMDYWDDALRTAPWFAGAEFSAADIQMSFPLEASHARADEGAHPHIRAFLARIHARPAYQRALAVGGPYELMS